MKKNKILGIVFIVIVLLLVMLLIINNRSKYMNNTTNTFSDRDIYVITKDTNFTKYEKITAYSSSTLKYNIIKKDGNEYSLIWVDDANAQLNSAIQDFGESFAPADILSNEIKTYEYSEKGLIAINGGPFLDGWANTPCVPFIINKGYILRDISNSVYDKNIYNTIGITRSGEIKVYSFSKDYYSTNKKVKDQMINDGVRNNFTIIDTIIDSNGNVTNNNEINKKTVLCQVNNRNFVIYSGNDLSSKEIGNELKDTFKCRVAYELNKGDSQALYYKISSMKSAKMILSGRNIPDMLYFTEQ